MSHFKASASVSKLCHQLNVNVVAKHRSPKLGQTLHVQVVNGVLNPLRALTTSKLFVVLLNDLLKFISLNLGGLASDNLHRQRDGLFNARNLHVDKIVLLVNLLNSEALTSIKDVTFVAA